MIRPCFYCGGTGKVSVSKGEVKESRYGNLKAVFHFKVACNSCKARGPVVSKTLSVVTGEFEDIAEYQRAYDRAIEKWNNPKGENQEWLKWAKE